MNRAFQSLFLTAQTTQRPLLLFVVLCATFRFNIPLIMSILVILSKKAFGVGLANYARAMVPIIPFSVPSVA